MASGWGRFLQCKSRALDDVYHPKPTPFLPSSGCRKTSRSISDVALVHHRRHNKRPHHRPQSPRRSTTMAGSSAISPTAPSPFPFFPTLAELPAGHSSRNVVEIIFHTSWSAASPAPPRIEMMFKVQNPAATAARFEEYREAVRSRAADTDARCLADGNEIMRFHCVGAASAGAVVGSDVCTFAGKEVAIRTFAGSGAAYEYTGGSKGRGAMLVCRIIAGRVCGEVESFPHGAAVDGYDSVSGEKDSLVVFDSRALLPCFLIIYKV